MGPRLPAAALVLLLLAPARAQDAPPPAPAPAPAGKLPRMFFRGRVASFEGRRIEIQYDFADPAQAEDWGPAYPFLKPASNGSWRVAQGALRGDGYAGWRHRAVFDGDVRLAATLACEDARNFGALVLDEDHGVFDLFGLADAYFALLDKKPPLMHSITTFQPAGTGPGGSTEWRYVATAYEPRVGGLPFDISVRKRGAQNEFRFAGTGKLDGEDKESRVGPRIVPAFYTLGSRVVVSKATITGNLDAKWLRENGILFEDKLPPDAEAPPAPGGKDPAPGATPSPDGGSAILWGDLVRRLSDASLPKAEREKAADDLAATKERRALRPLIDLLYSDEDATGREVAYKAFRAISGKEYGYRADAARDARLKAMPRIWDAWYAVKDALDREDRKKKE